MGSRWEGASLRNRGKVGLEVGCGEGQGIHCMGDGVKMAGGIGSVCDPTLPC